MSAVLINRTLRKRKERIDLRMRINKQVQDTKETIVFNLMDKYKITDFDRGLMLFTRCMNDQGVRNYILTVSQNYLV